MTTALIARAKQKRVIPPAFIVSEDLSAERSRRNQVRNKVLIKITSNMVEGENSSSGRRNSENEP